MADGFSTLGGSDGAPQPDRRYTAPDGSSWALYGVYVTSDGRMAPSGLISRYTVGVVFSEAVPVGPKQRRRFARFAPRSRWWLGESARWFAQSQPFGHPRELIAAAEAAGEPFRRPALGLAPR